MRPRHSLARSFACAGAGIILTIRTQRNARIHAAATAVVLALGAALRISTNEWLAVILAMGVVWTAELVNTAIETTVDLVSPSEHELARIAKDVAAGAVLMAALTSACVGAIVFAPRLWALWPL